MRDGMKSRIPGACAAAAVFLVLPLIAAASPDWRVRIRRDAYGVPHILAPSLEAAGYGLGYAQAEDHGLTMMRQYVAARGESARYYGTGIEDDLLLAFFDARSNAERDLAGSSRRMRRYLQGFADGVNRYVETHRSEFPPWVPRITAADLLAHRRAAAIRQVFSRDTVRSLERKSKGGAEPGEKPEPQTQPEWEGGSNAFALAGSRTASGVPILLGNPHPRPARGPRNHRRPAPGNRPARSVGQPGGVGEPRGGALPALLGYLQRRNEKPVRLALDAG
jgi:acyl-homoserine lactone acylase PvdQ